MEQELRPFWRKIAGFNWKFGLFLIVVFCTVRFIIVLDANESANYGLTGLMMAVYALVPFVFLNKEGRRAIGLTKPKKYSWLFWAFAAGLAFSVLLHLLGYLLYNTSFENWYVYIGNSYNIPAEISPSDKQTLFIISGITGMIFSPIGEELFFRGIVHTSFAKSIGEFKAALVASSAFALTHISNFGLVFLDNRWSFFAVPTIIWVVSMFLLSMLFYMCRRKSGSLLGSVLSHAAFNLGMIYCIFYFLN